jgi:hypothetical protein
MKNLIISFLIILFFLPLTAFAEKGNNQALTLLNQPQKSAAPQQQPQSTGQPQEIRDIHGPVALQNQSRMLVYGALLCLLLIVIVVVALLIKRRKKPEVPSIPPWEKALSDLTEARALLTSDLALRYMDRVSLILRKYVESCFAIKSTRQTTREFLHNLNKSSADPEVQSYKGELQTCLEQCDMAKFAHQVPQQQNMEMMETAIISFVEKTRPDEQLKGETA